MLISNSKIWIISFLIALVCQSQAVTTYWVNIDSPDQVAPYTNDWNQAAHSIQQVLPYVEDGDRIFVMKGTYTLTSSVVLTHDLEIVGWWLSGSDEVIFDGQGLYTCFNLGDTDSSLQYFTIRNGKTAAVRCSDTQPLVKNCIIETTAGTGMVLGQAERTIFRNNTGASNGGGANGTIAIDCVFSNNTATTGAGLYLGHATRCKFIANTASGSGGGMHSGIATDCVFRENSSSTYGGGMYRGTANDCSFNNNVVSSYGGGMAEGVANDCVFNENTSEDSGGGMYNGEANRCFFLGNQAIVNHGGGMQSGTANSCVFTENKAAGIGGGIYYVTANHCTLTANTAGTQGGGMHSGTVYNSIIWGNSAPDGTDIYNINNVYHSCSPDLAHGSRNCITNNPLLISDAYLVANSPCIGAGDASTSTGTDINGDAWNTAPAMGCDEIAGTLSGSIEMELMGPARVREYTEPEYFAHFNGQLARTIIDFSDGAPLTNAIGGITHFWSGGPTHTENVILTGFNETYPQGVSFTQQVQVVSSTDCDIHVALHGDDANDGGSWATAKRTIQAGVDAQNIYGGWVRIAGGTYHIAETILVDKPVRVRGFIDNAGDPLPVIDAGSSNRCVNLGYSDSTLEILTIQNGTASSSGDNSGGGVYCQNTTPRISYCTIQNCVAYYGAAVYKGTIDNSTLSGNQATAHGGAAYGSTLSKSTISSNSAQHGGGVYNGQLDECVLKNNTASNSGGGAVDGRITFSTISSNSAPNGGGIYGGTLDRCDVFGNEATTGSGGGTHATTAYSSILHHNRAATRGGGAYSGTFYNCTVANNEAETAGGVYSTTFYNSIDWDNAPESNISGAYHSCGPTLQHNGYYGNTTNAPLFVSYPPGIVTRGSDYYLSNFSPCLNAGDNSRVSTEKDFNGWDRILHGTVDIGACEMYVGGDSDGDGIDDSWELENFGGVTNAVATDNADTDPQNNYAEYVAGTDPFDAASYFRITQQELTNDVIVLHWDSVYNRSYQVFWSDSLTNEFQEIRPAVDYPVNSYILDKTNAAAFFQIKVQID